MAAISVSAWARNSSASHDEKSPVTMRPNSASASPADKSSVRAVGWPWSVLVAPMALKNARRWRWAAR